MCTRSGSFARQILDFWVLLVLGTRCKSSGPGPVDRASRVHCSLSSARGRTRRRGSLALVEFPDDRSGMGELDSGYAAGSKTELTGRYCQVCPGVGGAGRVGLRSLVGPTDSASREPRCTSGWVGRVWRRNRGSFRVASPAEIGSGRSGRGRASAGGWTRHTMVSVSRESIGRNGRILRSRVSLESWKGLFKCLFRILDRLDRQQLASFGRAR